MLTSTYVDHLPPRHYFSNINFLKKKNCGSMVNCPSITINRTPDYTSHGQSSCLTSCSLPAVELTIDLTVNRLPTTVVRPLSYCIKLFLSSCPFMPTEIRFFDVYSSPVSSFLHLSLQNEVKSLKKGYCQDPDNHYREIHHPELQAIVRQSLRGD